MRRLLTDVDSVSRGLITDTILALLLVAGAFAGLAWMVMHP